MKYLVKGIAEAKSAYSEDELNDEIKEVKAFLEAVEEVGKSEDEQRVAALVGEHKLLLEHVNSRWHKSKEVCPMGGKDIRIN